MAGIKTISDVKAGVLRPYRLEDLQNVWEGLNETLATGTTGKPRVICGFENGGNGILTAGVIGFNEKLYYYAGSSSAGGAQQGIPVGADIFADTINSTDIRVFGDGTTNVFDFNNVVTGSQGTGVLIGKATMANLDAWRLGFVADKSVTTQKLADNSVTTLKLADSAVTSQKIANGAVTEVDIATDAVTTDKIKNYNVTLNKLAAVPKQSLLGNSATVAFQASALSPLTVRSMLNVDESMYNTAKTDSSADNYQDREVVGVKFRGYQVYEASTAMRMQPYYGDKKYFSAIIVNQPLESVEIIVLTEQIGSFNVISSTGSRDRSYMFGVPSYARPGSDGVPRLMVASSCMSAEVGDAKGLYAGIIFTSPVESVGLILTVRYIKMPPK